MPAHGMTYPQLLALDPCSDSLKRVRKLLGGAKAWNGNVVTAQQARDAGCTFDDVLWAASALSRSDPDAERRLRLFLADCAARVLPIYEEFAPGDDRVRNCIIAARQFARGEIDGAARAAWAAQAARAAWAAEAAEAAQAAEAAEAARAAWAAQAAWAARAARAAWAAERDWQFDALVARFSDPEPDDVPLPARAVASQAA